MLPVQGLPLSTGSVDYYIIYGSDLAALHQPSNGYCQEAMQVLEQVKQAFPNDTANIQTINESENICHSYNY
jgi:hypothetical protein